MLKQIVKFSGVGVFCTILDFGILTLLVEILNISNILLANFASVAISTIVNYILSRKFVFNYEDNIKNFIIFVVLSIIGLGINELIIWVVSFNYLFAKLLASGVVMVFNFITRKMLLK